MAKKSVTEIVGIIVDELTPLASEERQRIVHAALTLLGEELIKTSKGTPDNQAGAVEEVGELPLRVRTWIQQNGLSMQQLQQVFHMNNGVAEVIAPDMPGRNNRDRVRNAYILTGIAQLLSIGEPKFNDKAARTLCETSGFYDSTNHAKYVKGGNEFTGSTDKGWTLTAPGLKAGANLVVQIAGQT